MDLPPWFSGEALIAAAAENELHATRRLITDWVSVGLIDQPYHRGRGQGRGSWQGTWSYEQACLFLDLLSLRQRPIDPVKHVAGLANVPVAGWLWMADFSGVPLRQVRRALATWCGRHRSRKEISLSRARKIAREMLKPVDNPHASKGDREVFLQFIATSIRRRELDTEQLVTVVGRVFDPRGVGRSLGPGAAALTVKGYARTLEAQATGYLELDSFSDQEFEDARIIYRQGRRDYVRDLPTLTADPQAKGSPFSFVDAGYESVINDACPNLLFVLGMGRLAPGRQRRLAADAQETDAQRQEEGRKALLLSMTQN